MASSRTVEMAVFAMFASNLGREKKRERLFFLERRRGQRADCRKTRLLRRTPILSEGGEGELLEGEREEGREELDLCSQKRRMDHSSNKKREFRKRVAVKPLVM